MELTKFTADQILAIPVEHPERLFRQDGFDAQYKQLMKVWHPDLSKKRKAAEVSKHLNVLHQEAKRKAAAGHWESDGFLSISGKDNKTRNIQYRKSFDFELGKCYYGDGVIAWVIDSQHKQLYTHALHTLSIVHYANLDMQHAFGPLLPKIKSSFEAKDGRCVIVMEKPRGAYRMRDVVDSLGGRMPPEAVAWQTSCLLNLACFFEWARISHGDISLDTLWVNPETHTVYILGGWWYATEVGQELKFLPTRSFKLAPRDTIATKLADQRTDVLLIKATGRELLGNPTGQGASSSPMMDFFRFPSANTAVEDYSHWKDRVLPRQFGASRFVELHVSESDVYKDRK